MKNPYEIFEALLVERGVTAYRVAKDTGLSSTLFSDWKSGKSAPKLDKLIQIADYFNVSIDYILGREKKKVSEKTLSEQEQQLLELFNSSTEKGKQNIITYAEATSEMSKKEFVQK